MLQVVPEARRDMVERADDEIKKGVEDAFKANKRVNDSGIKVASVNKGVVLLSGKSEVDGDASRGDPGRRRRKGRASRVTEVQVEP